MLRNSIIVIFVLLAFVLVVFFERGSLSYLQAIEQIYQHFFHHQILDSDGLILYQIRLPRILLALGVGAILALSGVVMQNIFRNPLVDPYLLGISSGAAFGCAVSIGFLGQYFLGFFAFLGAMMAMLLIVFLARFVNSSQTSLVLVGIVLSTLFSALAGLIKYFVPPEKAQTIVVWLLGSLSLATWNDVKLVFLALLVGGVPLFLLRYRLNVLALSDMESRSMGVNPTGLRMFCIIVVGLMCGVAVSVSGTIGWIGLIIPHFARLIVGANLQKLLPFSVFLGAIILLFMDFFARNITGNDLPVGTIAAIIGAPLFLSFLLGMRGRVF
ncbi:FecCD family ABC transporter permease [Helicobacter mustelae]|uniref:Putative iron compound ABC transporter, permease FecD n=1 Tax=Helicobacter mustelae (strain ATCC 43772 / CCUG 25715 / CIP 103759 / LMG 18044 / NCTC 12198 / R85-136P) TaxID=679897 RepID=D3UG30_HELM1|nr:iron ABC transporter permease [Helicobacter mustelae]CBG39451.1 putative iron compound ABC transporter, permease FecD [Helicobacter mustelae 12198]SQH70962.1 iron ABC transporter permease [Helicobacter mustelae]